MTNLETIANLVRACASCGVLHASGYRCASERALDRSMARYGRFASPTLSLAHVGLDVYGPMGKGTR